jgi:hypothetical protein
MCKVTVSYVLSIAKGSSQTGTGLRESLYVPSVCRSFRRETTESVIVQVTRKNKSLLAT